MVTDEGKGYDADGFEDAVVDDEGAAQLAFGLSGDAEGLGDYSDNDDDHADEGETTGFGELLGVS